MTQARTITVLGGGSFGTAISNIIATNGHSTYLWMRDAERAVRCEKNRENPEYLPGYKFNENLTVISDFAEIIKTSDIVVIAVPSKSFREVTKLVAPEISPGTIVISTTKGIESGSFDLMSQILEQELKDVKIGVLSGPNFAKEIIANHYTGTVVASEHEDVCELIQTVFSSRTFRIYRNPDRYGVELAGALKNIYALGTGMATALGSGQNTIAMILTRSLAEMSRFANRLGGNSITFLGLAGVGDLFLTCTSDLSRNFRVGYAVGEGKKLSETLAEIGQVAEGVNTLKLVKQKADELDVYMPLVQGLYAILFEEKNITQVIQRLMLSELSSDIDKT